MEKPPQSVNDKKLRENIIQQEVDSMLIAQAQFLNSPFGAKLKTYFNARLKRSQQLVGRLAVSSEVSDSQVRIAATVMDTIDTICEQLFDVNALKEEYTAYVENIIL